MSETTLARAAARRDAVAAAVDDIRAIETQKGVTRDGLEAIRARLMDLAQQAELFPEEDFPPPPNVSDKSATLYRVSEDADHRFALYVQSAFGRVEAPPHNHTTWAVIAGIRGGELNRFYDRTDDGGVTQSGKAVVKEGTAVAFLPDDLHSIHVDGHETVINFHMYGLALERLFERQYYRAAENDWKVFPPHSDIQEARSQ